MHRSRTTTTSNYAWDALGLKTEIEKAIRELGTCNVLIAGRTGVGKSTLINSTFHGRMAVTGHGRPVTKDARFISKESVPLGVWDTRGLEMADFEETLEELMRLVERRASDPDPRQHIHVAWLCVHEDGRRVQAAERNLCRTLAHQMPVMGVITKARSDEGFRAEVQRLLPEAVNVVRVRAISETLDDGHTLQPMGLEDLVEATMLLLPEGIRQAFSAAQRVSVRHKRQQARLAVISSAGAAAGAAATPIPFSDAVVLVPIQVAMLARVSVLYGLDVSRTFVTGLVTATIGPTGATVGGRAIAANLLKLLPGAGTVVGGLVSATTAVAVTTALGEMYIAALDAVFAKSGGHLPEPAAVESELRKRANAARRSSRFVGFRSRIRKLWPFQGKVKWKSGE